MVSVVITVNAIVYLILILNLETSFRITDLVELASIPLLSGFTTGVQQRLSSDRVLMQNDGILGCLEGPVMFVISISFELLYLAALSSCF